MAQDDERKLNLNLCDSDTYACIYYGVYEPITSTDKDSFGQTGESIDRLTAAYYGAEKVWDFNVEHYNHKSFDKRGSEIKIFGLDMFNAFWTTWNGIGETYYGYKPEVALSSLDVVAHELTHGTIDGTCQLVYQDESGALNEGFADAFGMLMYQ